jgi:hypothetical protein
MWSGFMHSAVYYCGVALTVRVPEALRRYSQGKGMVPAEGGTVRAALLSLPQDLRSRILDERGRARPYLLLYVAGEPATLDTPLASGATLEIVAAAEGG